MWSRNLDNKQTTDDSLSSVWVHPWIEKRERIYQFMLPQKLIPLRVTISFLRDFMQQKVFTNAFRTYSLKLFLLPWTNFGHASNGESIRLELNFCPYTVTLLASLCFQFALLSAMNEISGCLAVQSLKCLTQRTRDSKRGQLISLE